MEINKLDAEGNKQGEWIEYWSNGNIRLKVSYKDDKRNGECIAYYPNGNIESKMYFKDDKREGETVFYFPNGNISSKGYYTDDKLEGEYIGYHDNGNIESKRYYFQGCKWGVYVNLLNKTIGIGCKTKSIIRWDEWFAGTQTYTTPRSSDEFSLIEQTYLLAKEYLLKL